MRTTGIRIVLLFLLLATPGLLAQDDARNGVEARLDEAQTKIDEGAPEEALDVLDSLARERKRREKATPRETMLRGTARIMLGEVKAGSAQLESALEADPTLREGWLNLGGLEVAEGNYEAALEAFRKAHDLDPQAPESHLNLGATQVLLGHRVEAAEHFDRYLELEGGSADAHFLVATNYALAGLEHLALRHLGEAIERDERMRMKARQDRRFLALDSMEYRILLHTDAYRPPPDHHREAAAFRQKYSQKDNQLLYAVLGALRELEIAYDPAIEATARWALIWADDGLRIKVANQENETGVVRLSAPPDSFSDDEWQRTAQELFRQIHDELATESSPPLIPRNP